MLIIGNKRKFAFELLPVTPSWDSHYAPEKAAWAGTAIWVDGKNLCSHIIPGSSEIQEYLYVPLGPLVNWLVLAFPALEFQERAPVFATTSELHRSADQWFDARPPRGISEDDWLDARESWWAKHFLRAGADGALLPELAFVRDDEQLILDWVTPYFYGDDAPLMRWAEGRFAVPWHDGRTVFEELAATVARWFRQNSVAEAYFWTRHESPLREGETDIRQALEFFTGHSLSGLEEIFGAGERGSLLQELHLDPTSRDPAASPHCQILRDLSPTIGHDVGGALLDLGSAATRTDEEALAKWNVARTIALESSRSAESPEQAGYLAAPEIRQELGLNGRSIDDVPALLRELGLSYDHHQVNGGRDQMMVAVLQNGSPVARTLQTPRTLTRWGQRFEACRALGHILLDPIRAGTIGAASGPFAASTRRRRSGAFAAELLLPETAIARMSNHAVDGAAEPAVFRQLLETYGIGARTAAYQLWNRGWLSSSEIRDELIEEYRTVELG